MNKNIFEQIQKVIDTINIYNETKNIRHYTNDDIELIISIYEELTKMSVSRGCGSCVKYCSDVVWSYYEREFPKFKLEKMIENKATTNDVLNAIADLCVDDKPNKKTRTKKNEK